MPGISNRVATPRRASRNKYINSAPGILKRAGQIMEAAQPIEGRERTQVEIDTAAQNACAIIDKALESPKFLREPALWLRRARIMQVDSTLPDFTKFHAIERATRMLELSFQTDFKGLDIHEDMHLGHMMALACICEQKEKPELALRLLDIIDQLDPEPENQAYAASREALRLECQPLVVRPYIAPAHPDAISPSALPPAILKL